MNRVYSAKAIFVTLTPKGHDAASLILSDGAPTSGTFVEVAMDADESTVTSVMEGGGVVNIMPGTGDESLSPLSLQRFKTIR